MPHDLCEPCLMVVQLRLQQSSCAYTHQAHTEPPKMISHDDSRNDKLCASFALPLLSPRAHARHRGFSSGAFYKHGGHRVRGGEAGALVPPQTVRSHSHQEGGGAQRTHLNLWALRDANSMPPPPGYAPRAWPQGPRGFHIHQRGRSSALQSCFVGDATVRKERCGL